jgi:hypothetical protein
MIAAEARNKRGDTTMKRRVVLVGPILSIAGASGLMLFGAAIVGVMDGVLTYRVVDPPEPLPTSLGELKWVAISGTALTFGLVISCVAMAMRDSQRTISLAGKILQVVAGVLFLIGSISVLWGIVVAKRGFLVIATSGATPKPDDVREMVQSAAPILTVGSVILVVGAVVLLVAGQIKDRTEQTSAARAKLGNLAAIGSFAVAVVVSLLFVGIWLHANALETTFADAGVIMPKASELGQHLAAILNKSLLAFIAVGCQGALQAVAAIFASTSSSKQTPSDSE